MGRYEKRVVSKEELFPACEDVSWYAFLWEASEYVTMEEFTQDTVAITGKNDYSRLRRIANEYDEEMAVHNYNVNKDGELFRDHNRNYFVNMPILEQLWQKPRINKYD